MTAIYTVTVALIILLLLGEGDVNEEDKDRMV